MTTTLTTEQESFARRHGVRFATREGFWLTGMASTGPFTDANRRISALWTEVVAREDELAAQDSPEEWLSLCHGRETEFSCYIGLATDERPEHVPDGMVSVEVPTHEYAVAAVSGTQDDVNSVYMQLPEWIAAHGREWNRSILWIERYPEPYRDGETALNFEIWLPLNSMEPGRP